MQRYLAIDGAMGSCSKHLQRVHFCRPVSQRYFLGGVDGGVPLASRLSLHAFVNFSEVLNALACSLKQCTNAFALQNSPPRHRAPAPTEGPHLTAKETSTLQSDSL